MKNLVRPNILNLEPYSCARNEFKGEARVMLDANENPYGAPYNRYPDPLQTKVKERIAELKGVRTTQIMLGNGSDEPIDLVYRIFCQPGVDNVVAIEPTYGMYKVCADVNDVEYRPVLLDEHYHMNADNLLRATDDKTKVIWICSPNNPTGNLMNRAEMRKVLENFRGIVVVDEAYVDFSSEESWLSELNNYPRLIVLQTFSKAWGLAALRCGMAFASEEIIGLFNKIKYPYNINILTQEKVLEALKNYREKELRVCVLLSERALLIRQLKSIPTVKEIFPTDANFVLVRFDDANKTYNMLVEKGIIARNRSKVSLCKNCIRITVGVSEEDKELIEALRNNL